jgi:hypothetical protein
MQPKDRIAIAVCAAILVACVVHLVAPPSFIYYPLERSWRWERAESGVAMFWYGRSAWTLAAGAAVFGLAHFATGRLRGEAPAWLPKALAILSVGGLVLALGLIARHEWASWMLR